MAAAAAAAAAAAGAATKPFFCSLKPVKKFINFRVKSTASAYIFLLTKRKKREKETERDSN